MEDFELNPDIAPIIYSKSSANRALRTSKANSLEQVLSRYSPLNGTYSYSNDLRKIAPDVSPYLQSLVVSKAPEGYNSSNTNEESARELVEEFTAIKADKTKKKEKLKKSDQPKKTDCLVVVPQNTVPMAKHRKNIGAKKKPMDENAPPTDGELWNRSEIAKDMDAATNYKITKLDWDGQAKGIAQQTKPRRLTLDDIYKPTYMKDSEFAASETLLYAIGKAMPRRRSTIFIENVVAKITGDKVKGKRQKSPISNLSSISEIAITEEEKATTASLTKKSTHDVENKEKSSQDDNKKKNKPEEIVTVDVHENDEDHPKSDDKVAENTDTNNHESENSIHDNENKDNEKSATTYSIESDPLPVNKVDQSCSPLFFENESTKTKIATFKDYFSPISDVLPDSTLGFLPPPIDTTETSTNLNNYKTHDLISYSELLVASAKAASKIDPNNLHFPEEGEDFVSIMPNIPPPIPSLSQENSSEKHELQKSVSVNTDDLSNLAEIIQTEVRKAFKPNKNKLTEMEQSVPTDDEVTKKLDVMIESQTFLLSKIKSIEERQENESMDLIKKLQSEMRRSDAENQNKGNSRNKNRKKKMKQRYSRTSSVSSSEEEATNYHKSRKSRSRNGMKVFVPKQTDNSTDEDELAIITDNRSMQTHFRKNHQLREGDKDFDESVFNFTKPTKAQWPTGENRYDTESIKSQTSNINTGNFSQQKPVSPKPNHKISKMREKSKEPSVDNNKKSATHSTLKNQNDAVNIPTSGSTKTKKSKPKKSVIRLSGVKFVPNESKEELKQTIQNILNGGMDKNQNMLWSVIWAHRETDAVNRNSSQRSVSRLSQFSSASKRSLRRILSLKKKQRNSEFINLEQNADPTNVIAKVALHTLVAPDTNVKDPISPSEKDETGNDMYAPTHQRNVHPMRKQATYTSQRQDSGVELTDHGIKKGRPPWANRS